MFQASGAVKSDAELLSLGIRTIEIRFVPFLILTHEFDISVSRLCHFFQALFKWQVTKNCP